VPLHDWMQRYTLDCLGLTSFGFDFNSVKEPNNEYAQVYHRLVDTHEQARGVFWMRRLTSPWGLYDLLPLQANRQLKRDLEQWRELLGKMAKTGEGAPDNELVSHLIKANQATAVNHLSMEEIYSNLSVFFIAGHETSATSLAATLWYLARYPEAQQKLYEEVVRVCGKDETPTFQAQQELSYMTNVIYESNRLTPPVKFIPGRYVMHDTELGGIKLQKGNLVSINIEALHNLEREWPNAEKFDPDRFNSDVHRHGFSWQPFGGGPRACLGRNFSVLEQRVCLAKLLQAFRLELPKGASDVIQTAEFGLVRVTSAITLHPRA